MARILVGVLSGHPHLLNQIGTANGYAESTNAYHRNGGLNVQSWRSGSQES